MTRHRHRRYGLLGPGDVLGSGGSLPDIYGLGDSPELLTGRLPFNGSAEQVMRQHLQEAPVIPSEFPGDHAKLPSGLADQRPCQTAGCAFSSGAILSRSAGKVAGGTAATPPVQPSAQAAAPRPVQASTAGTPSVSSVSMTPQCPWRSPANTTPRQARADRSRYDPAHQEPLPAVRKQLGAPGELGTFWQELQQLSQPPLGKLVTLRSAAPSASALGIDPPTPPPAKPRPAAPAQEPPRRKALPPRRQIRRGKNLRQRRPETHAPSREACTHRKLAHEVYGDRWSQSDVWQPLTKMTQASPSACRNGTPFSSEELERQLDAQAATAAAATACTAMGL